MKPNIREHNRLAWDKQVELGNGWTIPVSTEAVQRARRGQWEIYLTPTKPVPRAWFPSQMEGCRVLCLASGGGQQGPILAAAGAQVTVLDNSPRQLAQDRLVAGRDGLEIATVEGDMADLFMFGEAAFDLVVNPVSVVFAPDVCAIWREAYRVLRPGGSLLAGFDNPDAFVFDPDLWEQGILQVKHTLPYAQVELLSEEEREQLLQKGEYLHFSHTLEELIGGQVAAGFVIAGFYEDINGPDDVLSQHMPAYFATRAIKPPVGEL